jgi:hypothetical protein
MAVPTVQSHVFFISIYLNNIPTLFKNRLFILVILSHAVLNCVLLSRAVLNHIVLANMILPTLSFAGHFVSDPVFFWQTTWLNV